MKDEACCPCDIVSSPPERERLEDRREHWDATNLPARGRPTEGVANEDLPLVEVDILPAEAPNLSGSHSRVDGDRERRALLGGEVGKIEHRTNLVVGEIGPILLGSCLTRDTHTLAGVCAGLPGRDRVGESRREGIEHVPDCLLGEWLAFARPVGRAWRDEFPQPLLDMSLLHGTECDRGQTRGEDVSIPQCAGVLDAPVCPPSLTIVQPLASPSRNGEALRMINEKLVIGLRLSARFVDRIEAPERLPLSVDRRA